MTITAGTFAKMAREQTARHMDLLDSEDARRADMTPRQRRTALAVDDIVAAGNATQSCVRGAKIETPRTVDDPTAPPPHADRAPLPAGTHEVPTANGYVMGIDPSKPSRDQPKPTMGRRGTIDALTEERDRLLRIREAS